MTKSVLIVEDEAFQREALAMLLQKRMGITALQAENGREAIDMLATAAGEHIRLVIMDINMPVMNGMEALEIITQQYPGLAVVMLTSSTDMNVAVSALQKGAVDFVSKPWAGDRMMTTIRNALKLSHLTQEVSRLRRKEKGELGFDDLVGKNGGLALVTQIGRKAAGTNIPVLITGETGTGKEIMARSIHGDSARAGKPFIAVNCGAIPANLIESTLFGHEKGAFTGAIAKTPGRFREADGGTIFLDEIGELTLDAQTKLLRVLQQKEVEPVGAAQTVRIDVRIISATNRNLEEEVKAGRFREDLFFRLNVLHIELPPLRLRPQDIPELAGYFLSRLMAEGHNFHELSPEALACLVKYSWPGNVRELENTLYRAIVLAEHSKLTEDDFGFLKDGHTQNALLPASTPALTLGLFNQTQFKTMADIEDEVINTVLHYFKGNVTQAAKALNIAKSTFYRRLK